MKHTLTSLLVISGLVPFSANAWILFCPGSGTTLDCLANACASHEGETFEGNDTAVVDRLTNLSKDFLKKCNNEELTKGCNDGNGYPFIGIKYNNKSSTKDIKRIKSSSFCDELNSRNNAWEEREKEMKNNHAVFSCIQNKAEYDKYKPKWDSTYDEDYAPRECVLSGCKKFATSYMDKITKADDMTPQKKGDPDLLKILENNILDECSKSREDIDALASMKEDRKNVLAVLVPEDINNYQTYKNVTVMDVGFPYVDKDSLLAQLDKSFLAEECPSAGNYVVRFMDKLEYPNILTNNALFNQKYDFKLAMEKCSSDLSIGPEQHYLQRDDYNVYSREKHICNFGTLSEAIDVINDINIGDVYISVINSDDDALCAFRRNSILQKTKIKTTSENRCKNANTFVLEIVNEAQTGYGSKNATAEDYDKCGSVVFDSSTKEKVQHIHTCNISVLHRGVANTLSFGPNKHMLQTCKHPREGDMFIQDKCFICEFDMFEHAKVVANILKDQKVGCSNFDINIKDPKTGEICYSITLN